MGWPSSDGAPGISKYPVGIRLASAAGQVYGA